MPHTHLIPSHPLQVSREDVAELCCQLLGQPAAANTTFEVGSSVPFSQPWTGGWVAGGREASGRMERRQQQWS